MKTFEVKPVTRYSGALYPSTFHAEPVVEEPFEDKPHPLFLLLAVMLALGVSVGLIGCYEDSRHIDGLPECSNDRVICTDTWTMELCIDEHWIELDCSAYCQEEYGWEYASGGCDPDAEDPCNCYYDVMDGFVDECTPEDIYCIDDNTYELCVEGWTYETRSCDDWCEENYGWDSYSIGCVDGGEEPCACEYDVLDGAQIECNPEDVWCVDDNTIEFCVDGWDFQTQSCDDYCVESYGIDAYSTGCVDEAEEPCQCEYGMVDGERIECTPGDVICYDDETLGTCDGWDYVSEGCQEHCAENFGPEFASYGCDPESDNPCLCEPDAMS